MNTINPPNKSLPVVSVVTPTYNQAAFLRDTIESVLSQDYPAIDYRVIDDGSTDETREILAEYDGRIIWETQPNMGQTPTINKGWKLATGDILTWLNSDDTFLPGAVKRAVEYLQQHPTVGIVYGDTLFTRPDGSPIERSHPPKGFESGFDYEKFVLHCENPIPQPSAFIRRSVIEQAGLLEPDYYYFMDWEFWLRAGLKTQITYVPELFSTYRLHPESKTVAQSLKAAPELKRMYSEFFARPDLPERIRRLQSRAVANMYFTSGGYYLAGGDQQAAAQSATRAIQVYPGGIFRPASLHKFAFCHLSTTPAWQFTRSLWRQLRIRQALPQS
jgi:glycosyltransferase involved in cell wall biosynthesis